MLHTCGLQCYPMRNIKYTSLMLTSHSTPGSVCRHSRTWTLDYRQHMYLLLHICQLNNLLIQIYPDNLMSVSAPLQWCRQDTVTTASYLQHTPVKEKYISQEIPAVLPRVFLRVVVFVPMHAVYCYCTHLCFCVCLCLQVRSVTVIHYQQEAVTSVHDTP